MLPARVMRSAPAPLVLLSVALLLAGAGCDCGRGRLVAAQGGAIRVTLIGADPQAVGLGIALTSGEKVRDTSAPITALPLVTLIDELPRASTARTSPPGTCSPPRSARSS